MTERLLAFVIWAAVAASAMYWTLRLGVTSPAAPTHTVAVDGSAAPRGDFARLFGATGAGGAQAPALAAESALAARFRLLGVAAPRQGGDRDGLALIAVDGKPARSYAVGAVVDGDLVLQSVSQRGARLGTRGAAVQVALDLPALPPPATGSLAPARAPQLGLPSPADQGMALSGAPGEPGPQAPASMPAQPSLQ
jgi:general secretion pathway protein C